jgi:hypothetical protein
MDGKRLTGDTEPPDKHGSSVMPANLDSRQIGGSGVHLDAGAITSAAAPLRNSGGRAAQGKMFGAASGTT